MNLLRKFIATSPRGEIASIPMGKFFLARSLRSPKGALECLFNDSSLSINMTSTPFCYQLSVTRAYQEDELASHSSDDDEEDADDKSSSEDARKSDERSFFLTEELDIRLYTKDDGTQVIAWRDISGDDGEMLEFAVDEEIKFSDVDLFMSAVYRCLYESKYGKSAATVSQEDLSHEFGSGRRSNMAVTEESLDALHNLASFKNEVEKSPMSQASADSSDDELFGDASNVPYFIFNRTVPVQGTTEEEFDVELRIFDPETDSFSLLTPKAIVSVVKSKNGVYYLVSAHDKFGFSVPINQELNPAFNTEYLSFIFNYYSTDVQGNGASFSLLFRFISGADMERFNSILTTSLSARLTRNTTESDTQYIQDALNALSLSELSDESSSSSEDERDERGSDEEEIRKIIRSQVQYKNSTPRSLFVPSDSEDDEEPEALEQKRFLHSKDANSGLAVGNANDRSYVTRGDRLGVFKHFNDNLSYVTTIDSIKDLDGTRFIPGSTMLYRRDGEMLMTSAKENDSLIRKMDLSRGQIVETWDVGGKYGLSSYAPTSKFAPLTDEQTLYGTSSNSIFRIDPRLSGSKIVTDSSQKVYKTNPGFENLAVTDEGFFAVGSKDGTIRLYEKLGKRATATLPSIGERYIGLDVTKDGRWIIATCASSLILIDTLIGSGQRHSGENGFKKYFDADKKPVPKRLTLRPEHVALITHTSGSSKINFTRAVFNTSLTSKETAIVTSTGPYMISWLLKDVIKNGQKAANYKIIRYNEDVITENFSFNSQSNIVAALQNDVVTAEQDVFQQANKKSISQVRRGG